MSTKVNTTTNLQSFADEQLLRHFSPPAVLVNAQGDILYISERTGKTNWNIFALARQEFNFDLGVALHKVLRKQEEILLKGLKVSTDSDVQT